MLVFSRKTHEKVVILVEGREPITIEATDVRRDKIKLGIQAPPDVQVHRWEVYQRILREKGGNE